MPADPVLSRELKSLHEELTTERRRPAQSADRPAEPPVSTGAVAPVDGGASPAGRSEESPAAQQVRSQLHDLVKEINDFVEEAEKNISTHPAMSVAAAMLLGIAIGSLLARR